jgi:regulator of replication initiation timing
MEDNVNMISQMNDGIIEFNKNLNQTDLLMGGIGDTLKTITTWVGAGAISLGFKDMVSSLMKINEEATKSAVILGKKAFGKDLKQNIKDISQNIVDLQKEIGVSTEKAKELTNAFLKARITENLHDATAAAAMFERATGATTDNIVDMYNEMYHGAKMSTESVNSVMASLSKVQHTAGLTEKGMNAVTKEAGRMAVQLRGFGATDKQIQNMTVSLGKYASSMEKVGVSAQEATAWVQELTNPDNIEKNVGLYAQMGISMSDALSGNFDAMQSGEQEFAQRIVDMGPIAGAAYAKQFGYSYSKAMKTMNLEDAGPIDTDPQEDAMKSLKEASEEVLGITGKISKLFNQIKGNILKFGPAILAGVAVIFALIKSKILGKAKKTLTSTVSESIQNGVQDGLKNLNGAKVGAGLTGLFKRNFDKANKSGGGYDKTGDLLGIHKTLSASGAKPGSNFSDTFSIYNAQVKKARQENANAELMQITQSKIARGKMYDEEIENTKRLMEKLDPNSKEYKKLSDRVGWMESNANSRGYRTSAEQMFLQGDKTKATQTIALQELSAKKTDAKSQLLKNQERKNEIESALRMAKNNKVGSREYEDAMAKLVKETGKDFNELSGVVKRSNGTLSSFAKELGDSGEDFVKLGDSIKQANEDIKNIEDKENLIKNTAVTEPDTSLGGRIKSKFKNGFAKVSNNFEDWKMRNGGGSFKKALGNSAGRVAIKGLSGLGKLAKSIGKLGLKFGVFGLLMKLLQPLITQIKEKLAPTLETLQTSIGDLFNSPDMQNLINNIADFAKDLVPALVDIAKAFMPVIIAILKPLLNLFIKLVNALLPPIVWILGQLLKFSGKIIEGLGHLPGLHALQDVGRSINKSGADMVNLYAAMKENKKSIDENTDTVKSSTEDKAAEMRVASKYGSTTLIERGAAIGNTDSAKTTAAVEKSTNALIENNLSTEQRAEEQKNLDEAILKGNFDIQKAVNLILDKLTGISGFIPVEVKK